MGTGAPNLASVRHLGGIAYCWAPAAAGTGIPRVLAAAITGEPAKGPRGEDVGTEEIPRGEQEDGCRSVNELGGAGCVLKAIHIYNS